MSYLSALLSNNCGFSERRDETLPSDLSKEESAPVAEDKLYKAAGHYDDRLCEFHKSLQISFKK